jgi:hypothetical protein
MAVRALTKKHFVYGCVLSVFPLLFAGALNCASTQKKTVASRTLCGVSLSASATKLLSKVEKLYGVKVIEIHDLPLPSTFHAGSWVTDDGVPEIQVKIGITPTEATIVHELMHLLDHAEGVPLPYLIPGPDLDINVSRFIRQLNDHVEHAYFFPKMQKMGIDPTVTGKADIHSEIQAHLRFPWDEWREPSLAMDYFICMAVLDDSGLAAEYEKTIFTPADNEAARLGRSAVAVTKNEKFVTPDDEMNVFIGVCNAILDGKFRITLQSVSKKQLGKITQRYANIQVERLRPLA